MNGKDFKFSAERIRLNAPALVSVIIPCYNQSVFLGEAIESVLAQSYKKYEIIVVNDGSTDRSSEIARKYADVKLIEQANAGLAAARNRGLKECAGEFVVFLDSDDKLLPNALETGVEAFAKNPECAFVSGFCRHIDYEGNPLEFISQPSVDNNSDHYRALLCNNYIWSPANVMYRREIFEKTASFDLKINPTADYELYLRIARDFPVFQHGEIVSEYRQHEENMSGDHVRMLENVLKVFEAQSEYVKNDANYKKALKSGIRYYLYLYGKKTFLRIFTALKKREWRKAAQSLRMFPAFLGIFSKNIMRILPDVFSSETEKSPPPMQADSVRTKPLIVIEPNRAWITRYFFELWHYRDLLYVLTKREIQIHYKQTVLGAAWAIVQPLFTMIIFTLFFGNLTGVPSDGLPYPIFAYAGIILWTFFSNALINSGNSLILNSNLITKVYFPRMLIPVATVAAGLLDLAISFGFLILMMFYYRMAPSANILIIPLLIALISLLAVGLGMWAAALNVRYRDVRYALPFFIQLGLFITPIIYPLSLVPEKWRWLLLLNPLAGLTEAFRAACFGKAFDWSSLAVSALITAAIFCLTTYAFRKMEDNFADII